MHVRLSWYLPKSMELNLKEKYFLFLFKTGTR
jgi:hypothetical protein